MVDMKIVFKISGILFVSRQTKPLPEGSFFASRSAWSPSEPMKMAKASKRYIWKIWGGGLVAVWPDLAKFRHLSKNEETFGNILKVYLVLGKVVNSLWDHFYFLGQIFFVVNGQILKKQSGHLVTLPSGQRPRILQWGSKFESRCGLHLNPTKCC